MAEIRINATGGVKLYDVDDSHYAQIVAGTITSNVDAITLGHDVVSIVDNLALTSDSAVLKFGADNDTTLTHTDGTGLTLNSTNKLCFNDASQFVQGSSATVLSIGATDEIDLTATAIDINGTCDISGTFSLGGTNITTTAAEINLIDGGTSRGTTAIADGDGVLINDDGTMRMTTVETLSTYIGGGITEADSWRLDTDFTGTAIIAANWERDDSKGGGYLGTGLSHSSGVWTFPSTGYWLVRFHANFTGSSLQSRHNLAHISVTEDNSSYSETTSGSTQMESDTNVNTSAITEQLIDCDNTTNVKFKLGTQPYNASVTTNGSTSENATMFFAVKLADT
jgi:hypothetical protein